MLEAVQRDPGSESRSPEAAGITGGNSLVAGWHEGLAIINLRGDADDEGFRRAVASAVGVELPVTPGTTSTNSLARIVWAGPDDWFIIGPRGQAEALAERLHAELAGLHHAVTDMSSGYTVLQLSGPSARDVLAQGCPLDLHPRVFARGACAGSHFFKASVWLWQTDDSPVYEMLVRRSFMDYVWLMLERASAEHGLVTRQSA